MFLLVADTRKGITDTRLFEFEKVTANIRQLITKAHENKCEVIFVLHDDGSGTVLSKETAYLFYNDFMWPKRYANFVSLDEAVKMIEEK